MPNLGSCAMALLNAALALIPSPRSNKFNPSLNEARASFEEVVAGMSVIFTSVFLSLLLLHDDDKMESNKHETKNAVIFFIHKFFKPDIPGG